MKILIIPSEEFIPPDKPLDGIFQYDQAKVLLKYGHEVSIISISNRFPMYQVGVSIIKNIIGIKSLYKKYSVKFLIFTFFKKLFFSKKMLISHENIEGLSVLRFDTKSFKYTSEENNIIKWTEAGLYVFKFYLNKYGIPDIIHAHNCLNAGLLALKIKNKYNLDYFITEHSSRIFTKNIPDILMSNIFEVYSNAKSVAAVSHALKNFIQNTFNIKNVPYVPNVLSSEFKNVNIEFTNKFKEEKPFTFINVAGLIEIKDHVTLITAFAKAFKGRKVLLKIVGDGYLKENIIKLVGQLDVTNQVELLGYKDRKNIIKLLLNCNVFVLSSKTETFGVVLIEALALGKPIIATKCGGPESIINSKNGLLSPVKDIVSLSKNMQLMYNTYKNYNQAEIRADCFKRFGENSFYHNITKFYQL